MTYREIKYTGHYTLIFSIISLIPYSQLILLEHDCRKNVYTRKKSAKSEVEFDAIFSAKNHN